MKLFEMDTENFFVCSDQNGVKYFEDASSILKIYPDGTLEFQSEDGLSGGTLVSEDTETAALSGVAEIVAAIFRELGVNPAGGGASLKLSSLSSSGDTVSLSFDYRVGGILLTLSEHDHAVVATVENGRLTEFKMCLKSFTPSSGEMTSENALSSILRAAVENSEGMIENAEFR